MSEEKKVSAIVVNWNGIKFLPVCLDSLFKQTYKNLEVIVVDCASKDESVPFIKSNYPLTKVIELKQDFGPPYAINLAVREAQGEYILILNNDVFLPEDLVCKTVNELRKDENSVINPIQLKMDGNLVGAGYSIPFFKVNRWLKLKGESPFYPCTACCLVTKKILMETPLNERFFIYEDLEWGWRLKLNKVKCRVATNTYFRHENAGTIGFRSPKQVRYATFSYLSTRYICLKNLTLLAFSPLLLLTLTKYFFRCWVRGAETMKAFLGGISDFLKKLHDHKAYRCAIQTERRVKSDLEIIKEIIASQNFEVEFKKNWHKEYYKIYEERLKEVCTN